MRATQPLAVLAVVVLLSGYLFGQGPPAPAPDAAKTQWDYNLTVDGYIIPNDSRM